MGYVPPSEADKRYVMATGDTMTGDLTVRPPTGAARLVVSAASGQYAGPVLQTDGKARWWFYKSTIAESGSNVGGDLRISRYDDAGAHIGIAVEINRASGVVTFEKNPAIAAAVSEADIAMASGWAHYGGSIGNCKVTRHGNQVILQGLPKRTSDLTPVAGTFYPVGTVPDGFLPDVIVYDMSYYNGGTSIVRVIIDLAGVVQMAFMPSTTLATGGWCPLNTSWRAA